MLPITLMLLPLLLLWVTWRFYRKECNVLVGWRKVLFLAGIAANAVSAAVLVSFTVRAYATLHGATPVDLDRVYPVLSMLGLGLLAAGLDSSGSRVSRL